jgi:O-antigen/teichoic acid export membrane protein
MKNKAWIYFSTSATNIICMMLGVVSGILSARLLGPEGRGELAVILYFPAVMGSIFPLAIPQALTFFISKDRNRQAEFATAGFRISLVLGILGSVIFALVSPRILAENNRHLSWAIAVVCLAAPAMVLNPHFYAIQRGMERFNWVNGMLILAGMGYPILLLVLWWFNIVSPLLVALSSLLLQMVISALHVWRLGFSTIRCSIGWQTYRECLIQGLKFFLPSIALTIFVISDRAILIRTTTLEEIGYYSVAFALTFPLTLVIEGFAQIGFVEVAGTKDGNTSLALATRRFQMAQAVVLAAALVMLPLVYPVIRFGFGKEFIPAVTGAYFLIPAMAMRGLVHTLDSSLRARDVAWAGALANLLALFCLIGLSAWLVPTGGVRGFSLSMLCAQGVALVLLTFCVRFLLSIPLLDLWGLRFSIFMSLLKNLLNLVKLGVFRHAYPDLTSSNN